MNLTIENNLYNYLKSTYTQSFSLRNALNSIHARDRREQITIRLTSIAAYIASRVECFDQQGLRGHGLSHSAQEFLRGKTFHLS